MDDGVEGKWRSSVRDWGVRKIKEGDQETKPGKIKL
jgi:hypothetical protein